MTDKLFYLIYGPPSSGKTTILAQLNAHCCEIDDYEGLYDKNGTIDFTKLTAAHDWSKNAFETAVQNGINPVAHTIINLESPHTQFYIETAKRYGYELKLLKPQHGFLFYENHLTDEEQINLMIANRSKSSEKYVPAHVILDRCLAMQPENPSLLQLVEQYKNQPNG